jgi:Lipocalin-like domain
MEKQLVSAIALVWVGCSSGGASTTGPLSAHTCSSPLLGTWKLQSYTTEYEDTGQKVEPFGAHPSGYLSYGTDCRMYGIVVREGRKSPAEVVATDTEKVELFDGMGAYAGTYTIEGDKVSHHVDISWIESWTGTTQVRQFKIEGNSLRIHSAPAQDPLDGRVSSATLVWTRDAPRRGGRIASHM